MRINFVNRVKLLDLWDIMRFFILIYLKVRETIFRIMIYIAIYKFSYLGIRISSNFMSRNVISNTLTRWNYHEIIRYTA